MKRADVKIGGVYYAKVSGKVVPVKITEDRGMAYENRGHVFLNPALRNKTKHRGWTAINALTGRTVHITTAAKLRGEAVRRRCLKCENCIRLAQEVVAAKLALADAIEPARTRLKDEWREHAKENPCLSPII